MNKNYNVVYSQDSNEMYTNYNQSLDGATVIARTPKDAAIKEAQEIFHAVDFPSIMVFFVQEIGARTWLKIMLDVIPIPTFELMETTQLDVTKLEAQS